MVVCTDGLANQGLGTIGKEAAEVPFYREMGARANQHGVTVSVLTLEGEECAMEHLGSTADLTGGQVEIVSPAALESQVSGIVARRFLGTNASVSVLASPGLSIDGETRVMRSLGTVSLDSDVAFNLRPIAALELASLQVQVRWIGRDGGEYLSVVGLTLPTTTDRQQLEELMDAEAVGVEAIQRAARLAQEGGGYRQARCLLISTQRLLQRGMSSPAVQKAYLPFIVQAEKLDQFIRERVAQEQLGVKTVQQRRAERDDEAARAIYQMKSLSLARFCREQQ